MMTKATGKDCEMCGRPIQRLRLEALPDTIYCVKCAVEAENLGLVQRKVLPEDYCATDLLDALDSDD